MSEWKEKEEEENGINMQQEWMLGDQLKSQGKIQANLPEDPQDVRKNGATEFLIKTGGNTHNEEEEWKSTVSSEIRALCNIGTY